jgi:hypothetical protein
MEIDKEGTKQMEIARKEIELDEITQAQMKNFICAVAEYHILQNVLPKTDENNIIDGDIYYTTEYMRETLAKVEPGKYTDIKKGLIITNCYKKSCYKASMLRDHSKYGIYIPEKIRIEDPQSRVNIRFVSVHELNRRPNDPTFTRTKQKFNEKYRSVIQRLTEYIDKHTKYMQQIKAKIQEYAQKYQDQKDFLIAVLKSITDKMKLKMENTKIKPREIELPENDENNIYPINIEREITQEENGEEKVVITDDTNYNYLLLFLYALLVTRASFKDISIINRSSTRDAFYANIREETTRDFFGDPPIQDNNTTKITEKNINNSEKRNTNTGYDQPLGAADAILKFLSLGGTRNKKKINTKNKKQRTMKQKTRHKKSYKYKCMQRII